MAHHLGDANQIQIGVLAVIIFSSLALLISASLPFSSNAIYIVLFRITRIKQEIWSFLIHLDKEISTQAIS